MKWFKHYENAHTNRLIQALLLERNGVELYGMYFLLLELLCGEFKKDTTEFILSTEQIKSALRVNYANKLHGFLMKLASFSHQFDTNLFTISQIEKNFYKIETPIILELMGKGFKRTRQCRASVTPKKEEKRKKNKKEEIELEAGAANKIDYGFYMTSWNNSLGEILSPIKKMSDKRKSLIRTLLREYPDFNLLNYLILIESSSFLTGLISNWKADFEWAFNHSNYLKVIEGRYKNNTTKRNAAQIKQDNMVEMLKETTDVN